jgi:DNA (cytosine-5)-methyltransferase 1
MPRRAKKRGLLNGIDLFAGAGGMSVGAGLAGVEVKYAVEMDPHAAKTYRTNHPNTLLLQTDIRKVTGFDVPRGDESWVLFGGPPCQGFSTSNQKTRSRSNPVNWLFEDYLRLVKVTLPGWVVFENVKGILETEGGLFVDQVVTGLEDLGYTVSTMLLNAMDFGIPQSRSRFFAVASLQGAKLQPPTPEKSIVTVAQAIGDLPKLSNGANISRLRYHKAAKTPYAEMMRGALKSSENHLVSNNNPTVIERYSFIPQGGNWEHIPERLMKNYKNRLGCHTGIYHRLKEDDVSIVIGNYRKNMLVHPTLDRGLSVREAARLQSFPDHFTFEGSIGFQQQQVGNAVPPLLSRVIFDAIRK